jgi:hypothetical protein
MVDADSLIFPVSDSRAAPDFSSGGAPDVQPMAKVKLIASNGKHFDFIAPPVDFIAPPRVFEGPRARSKKTPHVYHWTPYASI